MYRVLTQNAYVCKNVFVKLHISEIDQVSPKRLAELSHFPPGAGYAMVEVHAAPPHLREGTVALHLYGANRLVLLCCSAIRHKSGSKYSPASRNTSLHLCTVVVLTYPLKWHQSLPRPGPRILWRQSRFMLRTQQYRCLMITKRTYL